ncbi:Hypothetical predicted protein [Mytilus galloprovincialis]|uniref:Uncharacterized protein n=1 Tax=Mytilus galloprovincialis TaxID=29158 RepID=A0A8B6GGE9_MYTGA|nr:Hypothetical predicted protein [Mytilus galloprovincialis]
MYGFESILLVGLQFEMVRVSGKKILKAKFFIRHYSKLKDLYYIDFTQKHMLSRSSHEALACTIMSIFYHIYHRERSVRYLCLQMENTKCACLRKCEWLMNQFDMQKPELYRRRRQYSMAGLVPAKISDRYAKNGEDMLDVLSHDIMRYEMLAEKETFDALTSVLQGEQSHDNVELHEIEVNRLNNDNNNNDEGDPTETHEQRDTGSSRFRSVSNEDTDEFLRKNVNKKHGLQNKIRC